MQNDWAVVSEENSRNHRISLSVMGGFPIQNHRHLSRHHAGNMWLNSMYPREPIYCSLPGTGLGGGRGEGCSRHPAQGKSGLGRMWAGSQVDTSIPKGVQDSDDDGDRMMGGGTVGQWDGG